MKKFGKKLVLSGLALAATAATLSTTTYAWYVVNPTAEANGMTASTTEATADASVYVSKNGTAFSKTVTLEAGDYLYAGELDPLTTDDGLKFKDVTGADETTAAANYVQFALWVKSDNNASVTPKLTVVNNTTEFTKQTAYQTVADNAQSGTEFFVDAVQALRMSVYTFETAPANKDAVTLPDDATASIYDVQSIHKGAEDAPYTPATDSVLESALTMDANEYYTQIMGAEAGAAIDTEAATAQSTWSAITLEADKAVCMVFTFWLEGADASCFDSCVGQDFGFTIQFTAANE